MEQMTVNLKDQQADVTTYDWHLDDSYFSGVEGAEIQQGTVDVTLEVKRLTAAYDLTFRYRGTLTLLCDRCLEPMQQPVEGETTLRVRLGEAWEDDGDTITIPEADGTLDVTWNLYEMLALAIPLRHVHPDGACQTDIDFDGDDTTASDTDDAETNRPTDPRWDALKKVLNN
ncbi:MAG: DUF177 domain-containing protein [Bacteroidaceae bacterium]|nr:DUF177 domain-containing protein [Bacteroidaceae bacterium]